MHTLSTFQTLPKLIVDKTVEYLEGHPRNSFKPTLDEHKQQKAVLFPLLLASQCWRMATLASICEMCLLIFDYSTKAVEVKFPAWRTGVPYPRIRKNSLVKRVFVSVPLWNMCDGVFCEVITRPQYEGVMFPAAHTLVLCMSKAIEQTPTPALSPRPATNEEQVVNFVRSLRLLTPSLTSITVSFVSVNGAHSGHEQLYRTLLTELYQEGIKKLHAYSDTGSPTLLNMQTVTGLTSIVQISGMACSQFARLAYHNAENLRELIIRPATEANWLVLIYDGTETPAVFDSLASLSVIVADTSYATTWAAINDAKPFPILSKLDVGGGYPFDDDLLFRGNGGTLRSLRLSFSAIARNALCRFDILKRSGVTRMNSIHIGPVMEHDKVQLAERTDLPIVEQARRIFEVATALKANCDITGALVVFSTISTAPRPDTIQHLDFSKPIIELTGVILLISKLISLVSLTCNIRGLGASIESIPSNDRPRTLHAKYYPLSDNFRKLSVPSTAIASADMIARVAMLIAIVCPNFVHVDISPTLREDFSREIAWSTYCRSFKPFVNAISRLIYSD